MGMQKRRVCGQLAQRGPYQTVDVCRLEHGHEGPHSGRSIVWESPARKNQPSSIIKAKTPTERAEDVQRGRNEGVADS